MKEQEPVDRGTRIMLPQENLYRLGWIFSWRNYLGNTFLVLYIWRLSNNSLSFSCLASCNIDRRRAEKHRQKILNPSEAGNSTTARQENGLQPRNLTFLSLTSPSKFTLFLASPGLRGWLADKKGEEQQYVQLKALSCTECNEKLTSTENTKSIHWGWNVSLHSEPAYRLHHWSPIPMT